MSDKDCVITIACNQHCTANGVVCTFPLADL